MSKWGSEDSGSYEIGFGKPPKGAQWRKGVSGNPKGRPKGAKSIATVLSEMGRRRIKITANGRQQTVTMLEAMVMQLANQAVSGNLKAIRETFAAHRLFVEFEQAPEAEPDFRERDNAVIENLLRRMRAVDPGEETTR